MSNRINMSGASQMSPRTKKSRRPWGVSRRQRQKRLGFETLEDRRVMSASSPLASLQGYVAEGVGLEVQSLSSSTAAGQLAILQNELYWQSLLSTSGLLETATRSIPTDPLIGNQWHLLNVGQQVGNPDFQVIFGVPGEDINLAPVWDLGYTGAGVVVAVIDSGVETTHPDLAANIHPTLRLDAIDFDGDANPEVFPFDPDNPFFFDPGNAHGTAVAGLIGAVANNGLGGTGVAPGVQLVPIRLIDVGQTVQGTIDAFRFATDQIDITNNSWGPSDAIRSIDGPTVGEILALRDSVIFGRGGLGVIHVWAAGNGAGADFDQGFTDQGVWDTAAYDGYVASRYTIGVTSVDHDGFYNNFDGTVTSFAETSSGVLVAAPAGSALLDLANDTGIGSGLVTTDTTGETGFNVSPDPDTGQEFDRDYLDDEDFTSQFGSTSGSTGIVTGVIALMLEANPNLSWRDVQEILVRSARQNAEFDIPATANPLLFPTQNTWIQNQMAVFHDPDPFVPTIDPILQTFFPTLDPTLSFGFLGFLSGFNDLHFQPTPQTLTNGAGYTVSQGVGAGAENIGYAHGVIDAELAVLLAEQWSTKSQALPNELTFTTFVGPTQGPDLNIPAAEISDDDSFNQFVPGGIGGTVGGGFIDYWNEYFTDDPFADFDDDDFRGGFLEFTIPDNNAMAVETIEVKLSISGANAEFMNHARVLLVSPNGTHSELNQFWVENDPADDYIGPQNSSVATIFGNDQGSVDPNPGNFVWSFSTNRSWGERSDDAIIFDPTTNEPAAGVLATQGWRLFIENYSDTNAFAIAGLEVAWHGSPIQAGTERVQGLIGIDDNRDDAFNFSRVQPISFDIDGDPTTNRFGEVANLIDPTHETMAGNITVLAHRDVNANGILDGADILVDQFVTGADGNYYFDLVPDNYIFSLDADSLGEFSPLDDSLSPAGFLQDYQAQWAVNTDFFQVWDYDANLEVPIEAATDAPFDFFAGVGTPVVSGVQHINFLLDPGAPAAPEVVFSGSVFADIDGNGLFDGDDVVVPNVGIFGDVNRNGQFDGGEILTETGLDGTYSLTVPLGSPAVVNVAVLTPVDWTPTDPVPAGLYGRFVEPGDVISGLEPLPPGAEFDPNLNFSIMPPEFGTGDGSAQPGFLLGTVFEDITGDTIRQGFEQGVFGIDVYIDANDSGGLDPGEQTTTTNVNGGYAFGEVPAGTHRVRILLPDAFDQTFPIFNQPQVISLAGAATVSGIAFGIKNNATLDFGDLPDIYGTTLAADGARHPRGVYFLGARVDAETDGQPSAGADGDDFVMMDEDGVAVDLLDDTGVGRLVATASLYTGFLQGWVDFNGDGDFDDIVGGVSEQIIADELLVAGANEIFFAMPALADITADPIYARFRYGEFGLAATGLALVGEVEDYVLAKAGVGPATVEHGPDFDEDGDVDGSDFLAWQRGYGTTSGAAASDGDATSDGAVDEQDLGAWGANFGDGVSAAAAIQTPDFDLDGDADGADFLAWQRGYGTEAVATLSDGDGTLDGNVNAGDLSVWQQGFGTIGGSSGAIAAASSSLAFVPKSTVSTSIAETSVPVNLSATTESAAVPTELGEARADAFAAVASEVQRRLASFGPIASRFELNLPIARLESTIVDRAVRVGHDLADDLADLAIAQRDRALDRLFSSGRKVWEYVELSDDHLADEDEVFSAVLGEEIDWRFG